MTADSVVDLPGDQLGMITQSARHRAHDFFTVFPIHVAVETVSMPRSLAQKQAALVEREDFWVLFCEPDRWSSRGSAKHHLDSCTMHDVHRTAEPLEIVFALLRFAEAPGKFTHAYDIETG